MGCSWSCSSPLKHSTPQWDFSPDSTSLWDEFGLLHPWFGRASEWRNCTVCLFKVTCGTVQAVLSLTSCCSRHPLIALNFLFDPNCSPKQNIWGNNFKKTFSLRFLLVVSPIPSFCVNTLTWQAKVPVAVGSDIHKFPLGWSKFRFSSCSVWPAPASLYFPSLNVKKCRIYHSVLSFTLEGIPRNKSCFPSIRSILILQILLLVRVYLCVLYKTVSLDIFHTFSYKERNSTPFLINKDPYSTNLRTHSWEPLGEIFSICIWSTLGCGAAWF